MKEMKKQAPQKPFSLDSIKDIIAGNLGISRDKISDNSALVQDLGADSIDVVDISLSLENKLGCIIPINDAAKLTTPKEIYNYLSE